MEDQVKKNLRKLKLETAELFGKLKTEIPLALLLGTFPLLLFSYFKRDIDEILGGLLAIGPLVYYSVFLLAPYALVLIIKHTIRLSFDSTREKLNYIHLIVDEVGLGFLTITRTALGAIIGILILLHFSDIISGTPKQIANTYVNVAFLTIFNCLGALIKDWANKGINRPLERNPIRLGKKLY